MHVKGVDRACVPAQSYMKVLETRWILGMGCILKSPDSARVEKEIVREDRGTLGHVSVTQARRQRGLMETLRSCLICVPTKNCPVMRWGLQIAKCHRPRPDPPECKGK